MAVALPILILRLIGLALSIGPSCAILQESVLGPDREILPSQVFAGIFFGSSISVSGNKLAVRAGSPGQNEGTVYTYVKVEDEWLQTRLLFGTDTFLYSSYGSSISLTDDVLAVAVSGFRSATTGAESEGAIDIYYTDDEGFTYTFNQRLLSGEDEVNLFFPTHVETASIGQTKLVYASAPESSDESSGGIVYVYRADSARSSFEETTKLQASDSTLGDSFGLGLAAHENVILIAAPNQDRFLGAVYCFITIDDGFSFFQTAKLQPPEAPISEFNFGNNALALAATYAVICAPSQFEVFAGACYGYKTSDSGQSWELSQQLFPSSSGAVRVDAFGKKVAIDKGDILIAGTSESSRTQSAVFYFNTPDDGSSFTSQGILISNSSQQNANSFGTALAIYDSEAFVGDQFHDYIDSEEFLDSGTVFAYDLTQRTAETPTLAPFMQTSTLSPTILNSQPILPPTFLNTFLPSTGGPSSTQPSLESSLFTPTLLSSIESTSVQSSIVPSMQPSSIAPTNSPPAPEPTLKPTILFSPPTISFNFPTYDYPSYFEYPSFETARESSGRKDKQAKTTGVVLGQITSVLVGSQIAVAVLNGVVGKSSSTTMGVKSSALFLISMAFHGKLEVTRRSDTAAAAIFRKWAKQYNWLLFEWGPITRGNREDDEDGDFYNPDSSQSNPDNDVLRRRLVNASPHRCRAPRLADSVITVMIVIAAVIFVHVCIFALVGALAQAREGRADAERARREMDESLLWPRTLWPFAIFFVLALVLGAAPTMALDACWKNRGPAWAGLFVVVMSIILYGCALWIKVGPRINEHARFKSHHRSENTIGTLAPPGDLLAAAGRAIRNGESLYQRFGVGEWTESSALVHKRFVASHGAAFENFLPRYARIGEAIEAVPQISAALVLGITRRFKIVQAWTLFSLALLACIPLCKRPYVNAVFNTLELLAAFGNVFVLLFLGIAAMTTSSQKTQALIATALIIDVIIMLVVILLQVICAIAVLLHALFRYRHKKPEENDAVPQPLGSKEIQKNSLREEDVGVGANAGGNFVASSKEEGLNSKDIADKEDLGKVEAEDYAVDAAATSATAFGRSALTLLSAMSTAYRNPDATANKFFSVFCQLAAAEIVFIALWLVGMHDRSPMASSAVTRINTALEDTQRQQRSLASVFSEDEESAGFEMVHCDDATQAEHKEEGDSSPTVAPPPVPLATGTVRKDSSEEGDSLLPSIPTATLAANVPEEKATDQALIPA